MIEKANKEINVNVRIDDMVKQKIDDFINFWYINGVKLSASELARNAMDEYIETYDRTKVLIEGNMVGVRVNPLHYKYSDLFDMVVDAQIAMEKESDPSKKYLLSKQFEFLKRMSDIENTAAGVSNAYKTQKVEELTAIIYKLKKEIVGNVGGRK